MIKFITLFLALSGFSRAADQFWMNFPAGAKLGEWTMLFPAPAETIIYEHVRTAIDILEVKCDGEPVPPNIYIPNDYPDIAQIKSQGGSVIYQLQANQLSVYKSLERTRYGYEKKGFEIPDTAKVIAVTYLVRFPGGKVSSPMRVTFVASAAETLRLVLPEKK